MRNASKTSRTEEALENSGAGASLQAERPEGEEELMVFSNSRRREGVSGAVWKMRNLAGLGASRGPRSSVKGGAWEGRLRASRLFGDMVVRDVVKMIQGEGRVIVFDCGEEVEERRVTPSPGVAWASV